MLPLASGFSTSYRWLLNLLKKTVHHKNRAKASSTLLSHLVFEATTLTVCVVISLRKSEWFGIDQLNSADLFQVLLLAKPMPLYLPRDVRFTHYPAQRRFLFWLYKPYFSCCWHEIFRHDPKVCTWSIIALRHDLSWFTTIVFIGIIDPLMHWHTHELGIYSSNPKIEHPS